MIDVLLVFGAGAAVMILEILASRWLAPGFGFTLTTWACLISVTLLAGALGAALGGRWSNRPERLARVLLVAAFAVVLDALLAPVLVDSLLGAPGWTGVAVACLLLVAPAVMLLGAVLPMVVARVVSGDQTDGIGRRVGTLVAASTAGGLIGTLVAAFVAVPFVGLRLSALVLAVALAGLAAVSSRGTATRVAATVLVLGATATAVAVEETDDGAIATRETPYGLVDLCHAHVGYALRVNGIVRAAGSPALGGRGALLRHRQYVELLPYLRPEGEMLLLVGLGAGLIPLALRSHDIETHAIEINAGLVEVVQDHLGYDGPVTIADGRRAIRLLDESFDFIVLDAFQGEGLPSHLLTVEAFQEIRDRLTPDGVLAIHLIGKPSHEVTATVEHTLAAVFEETLCVRSQVGDVLQDIYVFASQERLSIPPHPDLVNAGWVGNETFVPASAGVAVATDDRTPLEVVNEPLARELRRSSLLD